MPAIVIKAFSGMAPRKAAGLLETYEAQLAQNCKLVSGELRPLMQPANILASPRGATTVVSMHRMGIDQTVDNQYWLTFTSDTDCVTGPVFKDGNERTYMMDGTQPTMTDLPAATGGTGTVYPNTVYNLGVPAPAAAPTVAVNGSSKTVTAARANGVQVTFTCASHGFKTGDSINIAGSSYAALNGVYSITVIDASTFSGNAPSALTIPAGGIGTVTADYAYFPQTRTYVYTYVSSRGEESGPSNPTTVTVNSPAQTCNLSGLSTGPTGNYDLSTKRIYRTNTGASGTIYQFVAEIPLAQATYADTTTDAGLGETMQTLTWTPPPAAARGLVALPNGIMACFDGHDLYFSEPFQPHAWPEQYALSTDYEIVALGVFATNLVVTTRAHPYIVTGTDPASMTMLRMELNQANQSKRSTVNILGYVIYAGNDGLVTVGQTGVRIATQTHLSKDDWRQLNPSSISGYAWGARYVGFYSGATLPGVPAQGGFIFDAENDTLTFTDQYATAGYADLARDALFLMINNEIVKWDRGASPYTYTWKSKVFQADLPLNFAAARVESSAYPVTFTLYADGTQQYQTSVQNYDAFRLPGGYLAQNFEIELSGTANINKVAVAESVDELKQL